MNRSLSIILSSLFLVYIITAFRFIPSGAKGTYSGHPAGDTINLLSFIRTDSSDIMILPPSKGLRYYRDGIVYLVSSKFSNKMIPLHESFGNLNTCYSIISDSLTGAPVPLIQNEHFLYPSDGMTFNNLYTVMYYSKEDKASGQYKIYKADLYPSKDGAENSWKPDSTYLSFCSDGSEYTHPALSADNNLMVFSSDRPGSEGGMDLFMSVYKDNKWSEPADIKGNINSGSNEGYPFLDKYNNLYFSSDRKNGAGGYDVYFSRYNGNSWDDPVNLGSPVNTAFNDIAFNINNKDGKSAFYSVQINRQTRIQLVNLRLRRAETGNSYADLGNLFSSVLKAGTVSFLYTAKKNQEQEKTEKVKQSEIERIDKPDTVKLTVKNPGQQTGSEKAVLSQAQTNKPTTEKTKQVKPDLPAVTSKAKTSQTVEKKVGAAVPATSSSKEFVKTDTVSAKQKTGTENAGSQSAPVISYRVQILSSTKPKGNNQISIANVPYDTYEYYYKGAYRICVGIFKSLRNAADFQSECRQNGYPQAFVVAFRDNVRSNDPALFRK